MRLLAALLLARSVRGDDEPGCVVASAAPWGLGSSLVHMLHGLKTLGDDAFFWDFSTSPYRCSANDTHGGWDAFFASASPAPSTRAPANCTHWKFQNLTQFNVASRKRANATSECADLCNVVRRVWKPSRVVQELVDYELQELEHFPRPLYALHVRGGDKEREIRPSYDYSIPAGLQRLRELASYSAGRGGTCVLVGDDASLAEPAAAEAERALGCRVINRVVPDHAHNQRVFNKEPLPFRCHSTKRLLVDLELLARADFSVGLALSNFYHIAALLQYCREQRLDMVDWGGLPLLSDLCTCVTPFACRHGGNEAPLPPSRASPPQWGSHRGAHGRRPPHGRSRGGSHSKGGDSARGSGGHAGRQRSRAPAQARERRPGGRGAF